MRALSDKTLTRALYTLPDKLDLSNNTISHDSESETTETRHNAHLIGESDDMVPHKYREARYPKILRQTSVPVANGGTDEKSAPSDMKSRENAYELRISSSIPAADMLHFKALGY
jgi:hypothetical protein